MAPTPGLVMLVIVLMRATNLLIPLVAGLVLGGVTTWLLIGGPTTVPAVPSAIRLAPATEAVPSTAPTPTPAPPAPSPAPAPPPPAPAPAPADIDDDDDGDDEPDDDPDPDDDD